MKITAENLKAEARQLKTETGESNPEYDRALVELVTYCLYGSSDHCEKCAQELGIKWPQ